RVLKRVNRGAAGPAPSIAPTEEEDLERARLSHRQEEASRATDRYKRLLARVAAEREIIEQFQQSAQEALKEGQLFINILPAPLAKKEAPGSDEEAVLVISDS